MALQEVAQKFRFTGGVETKMDSKAVPATRLLALENGVFYKASSIKKRNGYAARSRSIDGSTALVIGARRNAVRDTEYLLFTSNRCYSQQSGADQWTDVGAVICAAGSDRAAVHTSTHQVMPDHATKDGVTAYAWEDSLGGVWWTVEDTNGHVYRAPTQADASGQRPRVLVVGAVIHIYFVVPAQRQIKVIIVNPSNPTAAVSASILIDDLDTTNPVFDACECTYNNTCALMVWHEYATANVRVAYIDQSGVAGSPATGYPSGYTIAAALSASSPLACAWDSTGIQSAIVYQSGTNVKAAFLNSTFTSLIATQTMTAITTATRIAAVFDTSSGYLWVAAEETAAQASQRYTIVNNATSGFVGTARTLRSVGLATRAFVANNDAFATFVHDTTYFNTYLVLRLSDFIAIGRTLPGAATGAPSRTHLSSVRVEDSIATTVLPYKSRLESADNDKFTESALRLITLDFDDDDSHQCAQLGRGLYMAAACPMHYDGRVWTEQSFHFGPEYIPAPTKAGGGALTPSSTYEYKFWYEWTDGQGEIHRGPESVGLAVVLGGGESKATFQVPTLRVTQKSNVRICVARCLPGDASEFWRVSSLDPTTAGANNGYLANDTTVDSVTFVDAMSDATLQLQEPLYTTAGVLSNDPAALGPIVVASKNRLFFTDAGNGSRVRFSQRLAEGYGVEIAPELKVDVNPSGGDITALAVMDNVVYAFKASSIHAFGGPGPYETGSASNSSGVVTGFSDAEEVTRVVGCTDPSSIVDTPEGLMFKSEKGIWLLKRSRELQYIGAAVEAYNDQVVRRACVLPKRTAVLFLTDSGKSLYYDFYFDQWSTFTNHEGYDAAVVDGSYRYLRTNDIVFEEAVDTYSDAGARITLLLETAQLHMLEHLQGFQRFWRMLVLGTWSSAHQLGMQYRLSYDESWSDASWVDATGETDDAGWLTGEGCMPIGQDPISGSNYGDSVYGKGVYGGTGPDVYQWRYGIFEQGQAIQFRFQDFEKAGLAGASFELTEMLIVGGVEANDTRPFSGARSM